MAGSKSIKIISICKVVPPDSPSQFSLPLTFLDRITLNVTPFSYIFFYKLSEPCIDFYRTILPALNRSLSTTLKQYLPLAGNLIWPHDSNLPVIQYNDGDGVSLTVAESQADFDYLSGDAFRESAELRSLVPNFPSSETLIPTMTIQITVFPDRGFSIAYMVHHAVVDGKSTAVFMHSWAYICKKGGISVLPPELTPSYDRAFLEDHKELEKVYPKGFGPPIDLQSKKLPTFNMTPAYSTMLGTFKLTRENIDALKDEMKTKSNHTWVSSFTVTSAFVQLCLAKATNVTADSFFLGFSVDGRLRLDPPPLPNYFGNCLILTCGVWDAQELLAEDGFIKVVCVISDALSNLRNGILNEVVRLSSFNASFEANNCQPFFIGGSPQFELYKVDFGWGNPVKLDMISIDGGQAFSLSDDREDNGGIEIGIVLEKHDTEAFATVFASGLQTR